MLSVVRTNPQSDGEMAISPEFAAEVRRARLSKDMTQEQLAQRVGVTQGLISQIENGVAGSSSKILRICRALDIDPPHFLAFDDEKRWLRAGRILRRIKPAKFMLILQMVEHDTMGETDDSP